MSSTSIGRGPAHGSNENHAGDPTHTTLGEEASQDDAPAGGEGLQVPPVAPGGSARDPREEDGGRSRS